MGKQEGSVMDENEKRMLRRCYLASALEVYDDERDELLGHLVDITSRGFKIVGKQPLARGRNLRVRLTMPPPGPIKWELRCEAWSCWSRPEVDSSAYHATGFVLGQLNDQTLGLVMGLVNLFELDRRAEHSLQTMQ